MWGYVKITPKNVRLKLSFWSTTKSLFQYFAVDPSTQSTYKEKLFAYKTWILVGITFLFALVGIICLTVFLTAAEEVPKQGDGDDSRKNIPIESTIGTLISDLCTETLGFNHFCPICTFPLSQTTNYSTFLKIFEKKRGYVTKEVIFKSNNLFNSNKKRSPKKKKPKSEEHPISIIIKHRYSFVLIRIPMPLQPTRNPIN